MDSTHRTARLDPLSRHLQPERVETSERRQVRASEGSVGHVEVFRDGSVRTSILGETSTPPRHRRAAPPTPSSVMSRFAVATYEKCRKCGTTITVCASCKNKPGGDFIPGDRLTCSRCNSTGGLCKQHGAYWK